MYLSPLDELMQVVNLTCDPSALLFGRLWAINPSLSLLQEQHSHGHFLKVSSHSQSLLQLIIPSLPSNKQPQNHHHASHQAHPAHHYDHHHPRRPCRLRHLSNRMRRRRRGLLCSCRSSHGRDGGSCGPSCSPGLQCSLRVLSSRLLGCFGFTYSLSMVPNDGKVRYFRV